MKGVILAGGTGTRLRPLTHILNKHLLPVYDKPMILYPLRTLADWDIKDILLITGGENIGDFAEFLGDGSEYGVKLTYKVQEKAGGIAEALALAEDFIGGEQFAVILGDNIFTGLPDTIPSLSAPCTLFLKSVPNASRFGVFDRASWRIVEKPEVPPSDRAVTGLYVYDAAVFGYIKELEPSARGELEITDVNNRYLELGRAEIVNLDASGVFWSDSGTFESLLAASNHIAHA